MTAPPLRLGFPVKLMGAALKSSDARRWQSGPHLSVSLGYVDAILDHLASKGIAMYRMASDLAPYVTHPDLPQFHRQLNECGDRLAEVGAKARTLGIRLSFHPSQYILLNSPDEGLTARSIADFAWQAEVLDRMGLDDEAVMVTHVGGVYGDHEASRARWATNWERLPEFVRRRLVLEHDDLRFSAADVLWLHQRTGVRLIFDHQHHWCLNPEGLDELEALRACLATWPAGVRPKIHFSSPRTEFREQVRTVGKRKKTVQVPPVITGHADFANPFEFITFMRLAQGLEFDVMLEGKAKDLGLLRLRSDLARLAPDVAARFGAAGAEEEDVTADEDPADDFDVDEAAPLMDAAE